MPVIDSKEIINSLNIDLPNIEQQILDFWQQKSVFAGSLNKDLPPYVYYDGPPFATGLPHHGHLLASTIKDVIGRYFTMKGYYVERRFGWDCHGLPIEYEIDKKHQKSTNELVEQYGIAGYNNLCREIVQLYTEQWQETINKLGRWVDFDNDYKTMDPDFMESVWWVFKQLWDQGLIYQGTKVVAYSTKLGTVLSNFEAGSNYQNVQDPSLFVILDLVDNSKESILIWTTTPWTLPSNLGVCVGPDIEYSLIKSTVVGDKLIWVASAQVNNLFTEYEVIKTALGSDLVGLRYQPLFDYFKDTVGAFAIFADDFVSTEDGTGLVHMAPAFGEDDHRIMTGAGVEVVCPVDSQGCFAKEVHDFAGQYVKDADKAIIQYLKAKGLVFKHSTIEHSYPHCPRSDTPLIYKAIPSWYVKVTALKSRLLAANAKINWVPEHVKDGRFGSWLENVKDWSISRNRVWGNPVPLWVNDVTGAVKCIGSRAELYTLTGVQIDDLHREHVDDLTFTLESEPGVYRRVSEVLDCWFESGAMPYAQKHYPFKDKDDFQSGFPAAFIAEGLDQTRGWFYTLTVLSVALFDKPAFENVIVSGIVSAEDGRKMSKRLKNYTPPKDLIDTYGADALRLYLINSGLVKAQEQRFKDQGVKEMVRQTILPWYNAAKFLLTYAKVDQWNTTLVTDYHNYTILDKWLLSRLQSIKHAVATAMQQYTLYLVVPELLKFLDELTNIYIRLNRNRFWATGLELDKCAAYSVLYKSLLEFSICMAPFAPFGAESIYQLLLELAPEVPDSTASVHHQDYPLASQELIDKDLESAVLRMHQVIVLGRQCRNTAKVKTKIPLRSIKILHRDHKLLDNIKPLTTIIQQELNVFAVDYEVAEADYIELKAQPCSPILGKKYGSDFGKVRAVIENMTVAQILEYESAGKIDLTDYSFVAGEINILRKVKANLANVATNQWVSIQLDCQLDPELIAHGLAREVINRVQKTRKDMQLNVSDRIVLSIAGDIKLVEIIEQHQQLIKQETLTTNIDFVIDNNLAYSYEYLIDEYKLSLDISVV